MVTANEQRFTQAMSLPNSGGAQDFARAVREDFVPLMIAFEKSWPIGRILLQITGTVLVLGAAAMWVLPGSQVAADLILMKLGFSVFMLLCGVAILMVNHVDNRPDAYFDPIRREVRVLQKDSRGRPHTVLRRGYDSLGSARFTDRSIELCDMDGSILMRLRIKTPEIRQALRSQLCESVQILT